MQKNAIVWAKKTKIRLLCVKVINFVRNSSGLTEYQT